ncbi:MAG: TIGR04282 family arsenosugar biosynthesis glycosyltransferase [Balneolaceae bacterium]
MPKNKLIIFVKNEEAGKVKTRLAKSVGNEKALKIYQKLLAYTAHITKSVHAQKEVWYSRFIPKNDIWSKGEFGKKIQEGEDLGQRMLNAFRDSFEEGFEHVVIIGSDCEELTQEIITDAFQKLETSDFIIGPAKDGGYYLLGMNSFHTEVFTGINWSTSSVLQQTISIIEEKKAGYILLKELNDIDTLEDWQKQKTV